MRYTTFALFQMLLLAVLWVGASSFYFSEEFGKAGYYADSLHGRKTSSGEKYDKNLLTCAHKTLPFGTKVRVTRLDNKRSVVVKVNDRGPFSTGYVIDLSRKAAQQLDLIQAGNARVKVEVVEEASGKKTGATTLPTEAQKTTVVKAMTPSDSPDGEVQLLRPVQHSTPDKATPTLSAKGDPEKTGAASSSSAAASKKAPARKSDLLKVDISTAPKKGFGVQVNTMNDADNVLPVIRKLRKDYPGKVLVTVERDETTDVSTYRIIIGPFGTRNAADAQQKLAEKRGYKKCFVVDLAEM